MKLSHSVGRGAALGCLTSVFGSVFVIIPAALVVRSIPQFGYGIDNTIFDVAMIVVIPLSYFFLHIIPDILGGIFVSYVWGRFFLSPFLKTMSALLAILIPFVCVEFMYTVVSGFSDYTLMDYVRIAGTEFFYVVAFVLLANKVLLSSGRNDQEPVN